VLDSTASKYKVNRVISIARGGEAGATDILVGSMLTPDEQEFVTAYNSARESIQSLRQFLGSARSTAALYTAMARMLPNPLTSNSRQAAQQLNVLNQQIKTIRNRIGKSGLDETESDENPYRQSAASK
jgi:membrane protein insertase Oxa1/YidC/SpoIIIJ